MISISLSEFVPPIAFRAFRKLQRMLNQVRQHPFDNIPAGVKPKFFLDIGANIGEVTEAALTTYPDCKAICFEPVGSTFKTLKSNLAKYKDRVTYFNMGLSDSTSESEINISSFHGASSILPQSDLHVKSSGAREVTKEKIQLVRLDEVCTQFPTKYVDVMKIDVEGFENHVLKGGMNFMSNCVDVVILEVSPYRVSLTDDHVADVFGLMKQAGFVLINIFAVQQINTHPSQMLAHMDCVFRKKENL